MTRLSTQSTTTLVTTTLLAALLFTTSSSALAAGSGTIFMKGKTAQVKDAIAYRHPASYDATVTMTTIVVCDKAIDAKKVGEGADRDKAVHEWLDATKAVYWEAILYPDGSVWTTNTIWPGLYSINGGGSDRYMHMTKSDAKRLEGTYVDPDDKDKEENNLVPSAESDIAYLDLKFAVDVQ